MGESHDGIHAKKEDKEPPSRGLLDGLRDFGNLVDHETFEQFEAIAEEVATIEIPRPVHYPPSPPSTFMVPDFPDESSSSSDDEDDDSLATPLMSPLRPLLAMPPRPPQRALEYPPGTLPTSFSFACGGWLQFYMFGVAKCLRDHGVHKKATFSGCSAGALTALGLAVEAGSFDKAVEYCKKICIPQCRRTLLGPFLLHKYVKGCLDYSGGLEQWQQAQGKLQVAVTRLPEFSSMRVTSFDTKDDLVKALLASAAAFPLAPPVHFKGKWFIDGGIADFQPIQDADTVTVNPFYFSQADIRPSRYVPAWWSLLPPSSSATVDWLYDLGFCDGLKWMERANLDSTCKQRCRRRPDDPLSCKHRPERDPHPFDESSKTFNRFFGYGRWPVLVDHMTLVTVAVVWRTSAFVLIYTELAIKLTIVAVAALAKETASISLGVLLVLALLLPSLAHTAVGLVLLLVASIATKGAVGHWHPVGELARTLCSLTLLLRAIPILGTRVHLRKHHKLFRQSLVYRICVHII